MVQYGLKIQEMDGRCYNIFSSPHESFPSVCCIVLVLWRFQAPNSLVLGYKGRNICYLLLLLAYIYLRKI